MPIPARINKNVFKFQYMKELGSPSNFLSSLDIKSPPSKKEAGPDASVIKMMLTFEQKINFLEMQHKEALEREENLRKLNNSIMFAFSDIHKDGETLAKPSGAAKQKTDDLQVSQFLLESAQKKHDLKIEELEKEIELRKNELKRVELDKNKEIRELRAIIEKHEEDNRIRVTLQAKKEEEIRFMKEAIETELSSLVANKESEILHIHKKYRQELLEKEKEFSSRILMIQSLNDQEKRSYVSRIENLQKEKDVMSRNNGQNLVVYEDLKANMLEEINQFRKQAEEQRQKCLELERVIFDLRTKIISKECENEKLKQELDRLGWERPRLESPRGRISKEKLQEIGEMKFHKQDLENNEQGRERESTDPSGCLSSRTPNKESKENDSRNIEMFSRKEEKGRIGHSNFRSSKSPIARSYNNRTPVSISKKGTSTGPLSLNFDEDDLKSVLRPGESHLSIGHSINPSSKQTALLGGEPELNNKSTPTVLSKILKELDIKNIASIDRGKRSGASKPFEKQEDRTSVEDSALRMRKCVGGDAKENLGKASGYVPSFRFNEASESSDVTREGTAQRKELNIDKSLASLLRYTPKKKMVPNANTIQEEIKKKITSMHQRSLSSNMLVSNQKASVDQEVLQKCQTTCKPTRESSENQPDEKLLARAEISHFTNTERNELLFTISPKNNNKIQQNPSELKFEILNLFDKVIKISDSQNFKELCEQPWSKASTKKCKDRRQPC